MYCQMQASQLAGLSDDSRWSQTYAQDDIIATLEIVSDGFFSAKEQGNKFLLELIELIKKRQPQDKLTFTRLVGQYIDAAIISRKIISLIIGKQVEDCIYLFCKTNGSALIKRGNLWSEIINGEGLVSGNIQPKDILIFSTDTFRKLLPNELVMEKFSLELDPRFISEKIGALLHNFDNSKGAAAVFAYFGEMIEQTVQETQIKSDVVNSPNLNNLMGYAEISQENRVLAAISELEQLKHDVLTQNNIQLNQPVPIDLPLEVPVSVSEKERAEPVKSHGFNWESKVQSFTNSIKDILPQKRLAGEAVIPGIRVSIVEKIFATPKKIVLSSAIVLSLLLLASFILGTNNFSARKSVSLNFEKDIAGIISQIEEGEGLADLNNVKARSLLSSALSSLTQIQSQYKTGSKERIQIDDLLKRSETALNNAVKIYKIESPSIFLDLTVVKPGAGALNFSLYENTLAVLDNKNISVLSVDVEKVASTIVGGGAKTPQPSLIASFGTNIFVLTSDGLVRIDSKSKNQQAVVKNLKEVGQAVDMVGFAGNVYLLDQSSKKIWKIMLAEDGYLDPRTYLASGETIPFETVKGMAIDGSVWVLGDLRIKKYERGNQTPVSLEGLDSPLTNPTAIYTDDLCENLYILDKGASRVVVFDKNGLYQSQYVWSGISSVSDLAVSEKNKKIFLLSGSIIYAIDLK